MKKATKKVASKKTTGTNPAEQFSASEIRAQQLIQKYLIQRVTSGIPWVEQFYPLNSPWPTMVLDDGLGGYWISADGDLRNIGAATVTEVVAQVSPTQIPNPIAPVSTLPTTFALVSGSNFYFYGSGTSPDHMGHLIPILPPGSGPQWLYIYGKISSGRKVEPAEIRLNPFPWITTDHGDIST